VVEEANAFSAGGNGACSDGRSGEDKYGGGEVTGTGNESSQKRSLYDGGGQEEKLLHLWGFWVHGLSLQELGKRKSNGRKKSRIWRKV